jgi:hypothetical protein
VKAINANQAWFSTDKGLAFYDGSNCSVYRPALDTGKPEMYVRDAEARITQIDVGTPPIPAGDLKVAVFGSRAVERLCDPAVKQAIADSRIAGLKFSVMGIDSEQSVGQGQRATCSGSLR